MDKTNKMREALQALYACQSGAPSPAMEVAWDDAMSLARQALAEAEPSAQEPVAEVRETLGKTGTYVQVYSSLKPGDKLYTHPTPEVVRKLPRLTDDEIERNWQFLHDEEGNPPDQHVFASAIMVAMQAKARGES